MSARLNHELRIRCIGHLNRISIDDERLRAAQAQRTAHVNPAIRLGRGAGPTNSETNRVCVSSAAPDSHAGHREAVILRHARNRRLCASRLRAHHKTDEIDVITVVRAPVSDQLLNLIVEVICRQLQLPRRRGRCAVPALRSSARTLRSSGGGGLPLGGGRRRRVVPIVSSVETGARACVGCASVPCGRCQLRGRDSERQNEESTRKECHKGAREGTMSVSAVGVLVVAGAEPSGQGKRACEQTNSRGDNPETRGRRDERRIATRQ